MKTLKLFVLVVGLFIAGSTQAQVSISFNLGAPPQWAPVENYNAHYYYLPDVESYYDVDARMFIYLNGGNWVHRSALPLRYRNYDLYHGYKVVMSDYHGNQPYANFRDYKVKYGKGYHGQPQKSIGDRPGRSNRQSMERNNSGRRENIQRNDQRNDQKKSKKNKR